MREKRMEIGQLSGRKQLLISILRDVTDEEIEAIYELIADSRLYDLARIIHAGRMI